MSYDDKLRDIANRFFEVHQRRQASSREMAAWAIHNGLWEARKTDYIDQCAEHLSRAMREEHYVDPQGRSVRTKHAARLTEGAKQHTLWADIRTGPRDHIRIALQQRRSQILGDCRQLKYDADSFNENRSLDKPIQVSFDFRRDLEELDAASGF